MSHTVSEVVCVIGENCLIMTDEMAAMLDICHGSANQSYQNTVDWCLDAA
jgi:hypothetical protein